MAWTAVDLLADVRRSGMIPTAAPTGTTDADLLLQADKEMQTSMVDFVMGVQEEFFLRWIDIPIVPNQPMYRLPRKAMFNRLRSVNIVVGGAINRLPRVTVERLPDYSFQPIGQPQAFRLEASSVVLVPSPSLAATLRVYYFARPGRLVSPVSATQIISITPEITPGVTRLTVGSTGTITQPVDLIAATPSFEHIAVDVPASFGATTVDIASSALSGAVGQLSVGDWVCSQDTSPVPQIPVEMHGILAQRTVARTLLSLDMKAEAAAAYQDVERMEKACLATISTRADGSPQKMSRGFLSQAARNGWWWR